MYQGGLCCLLVTMMTICVANQEAELKDQRIVEHPPSNGVHDPHATHKGHTKKKEHLTTIGSVAEQQEEKLIEKSTTSLPTLAISNADIQSAAVNNKSSVSLTEKLTSSSSSSSSSSSLATSTSTLPSTRITTSLVETLATINAKLVSATSELSTIAATSSTISSVSNSKAGSRNSSEGLLTATHHNNSRIQRISAVKVTLPPAGGKSAVGIAAKNSKINAPPGLNYVFDAHPNINKHHHHDYRYGPHFETGNVTNITVQAGSTFYLHCRISLLLDKTVSWVHRRQGQTALQLLTVGKQTYSGDARYTIDFQYPNNWRLKIESVIKDDEGVYECQVSTHPPRIITYHLHVNDPKILIVDEKGNALLDKYVQVDSTIKLACIVRHISMTSSVVFWMHGSTILNYDLTRGGINVKTDLKDFGANSTLFVAKVNQSDSGNYTCSIGPHQYYTVTVHVLNGKSFAELHHSSSSQSIHTFARQNFHQLAALFITIILFVSNSNFVASTAAKSIRASRTHAVPSSMQSTAVR
ncbi:uncharacterized protein LOC134837883 [Culicoides brevitarsis]|uniref:uncharacterized protein LOC134837883 n=1 Tax=Culicoides brevitarsis TaxID=469753 RepID=UPI00307B807B